MQTYKIAPSSLESNQKLSIKILDVKKLYFDDIKSIKFTEVSDIAYKNGDLFAVSDNGYLYKFSILLEHNKIKKLFMQDAYILRNKKGLTLKKKKRDAEGLAFLGNELLISFERKHRVDLHNLQGRKIRKIKINKTLRDRGSYRGENKGLEAVTYSKKYGVLTAPEKPMKYKNENLHTLYSKKERYSFRSKGSITALEFMDEERVLILLREFHTLTRQRVMRLLSVNLSQCRKSVCTPKTLAVLDSFKGWYLDNFEGLTKVSKNNYLMISDDNDSFFQKTLLVLFEVMN